MNLLLILTSSPHDPVAWHAVQLAKTACDDSETKLATFFYQDAVQIANAFTWQPQDKPNLQRAWQELVLTHKLELPVCVSAALARGVTDTDNAKRHGLRQTTGELANNLADGFTLVGLGELAEAAYWADIILTDAVISDNTSNIPKSQRDTNQSDTNQNDTNQSAKKILVLLDNPNRLQLEEGISAAMVMASFDHDVQLALSEQTACILENNTSKAYKMLTSLELYDMPPLWVLHDQTASTQTGIDMRQHAKHKSDINVELITTQQLEKSSSEFDTVLTL